MTYLLDKCHPVKSAFQLCVSAPSHVVRSRTSQVQKGEKHQTDDRVRVGCVAFLSHSLERGTIEIDLDWSPRQRHAHSGTTHKHPNAQLNGFKSSACTHVHMSHTAPEITGTRSRARRASTLGVEWPHINWKRHRHANSRVLTTERSQRLR